MIRICSNAFDPWQVVSEYQNSQPLIKGQYGATSVFVGTLRDFNDNESVKGMMLEHYPVMTEKYLEKIVAEAKQRWPVMRALVMHRVGFVMPNDPIVLVVVWTSHRGDAFDACRYIIDALKSKAPFWKKERLENNEERWVEHNTDGYLKSEKK